MASAVNNRSVRLSRAECAALRPGLMRPPIPDEITALSDRIVVGDSLSLLSHLPDACVDLAILDPPYNLKKTVGDVSYRPMALEEYGRWLESWLRDLLPRLKREASVYLCGDWRSAGAIQPVLERHLIVRNRITWEREKGRGAKANWKNASEDIWYCTVSGQYHFDVEAVKLRRRVLAPYRDDGRPKDWEQTEQGRFRLTHPSNLWTDITVPFWSMPENTEHPTQKPEKLVAKLLLASSRPGDLVFDPFLGSGTTAVVARKLGRRFLGIEANERYACLALKRLALADEAPGIQGYMDGCFWERNALSQPTKTRAPLSR